MDVNRKNINLSMLKDVREKDLGMGTPYERWALYNLLEKLYFVYDFKTVLEGPADGMSGIKGLNSFTLSKLNCKVNVCLPEKEQIDLAEKIADKYKINVTFTESDYFHLPFPDTTYDLVWNFCAAHILNPDKLIDDMIRVSKKYVMIIVPNSRNYGFFLHRLNHFITGEPWIHGDINLMDRGRWSRKLKKKGLRVVNRFYVDVPFWPDIDKPPEMLLGDFLPFLKGWLKKRVGKRYDDTGYNIDNLPYYSQDTDFEKLMNRLSFIERNFPEFIKILFAHHSGILAEK